MEREPVAWKVVEPGWQVVARDGQRVGEVAEVVGDREADIFGGFSVELDGHDATRLVDPAQLDGIVTGQVRLALSATEAAELPRYEPPAPQLAVSGAGATWLERVRTWLSGGVRRR